MNSRNYDATMTKKSRHDFHHSHNSGNYGGFFMFWDWACGTDAAYKRHLRAAKRD